MSGRRVRNAAIRYGTPHRKARERALAQLVPGTPCYYCREPMYPDQFLDLGHAEGGGYIGLTHRRCNRQAAQLKQVRLEQLKLQVWQPQPPPWPADMPLRKCSAECHGHPPWSRGRCW